MIKTANDFENLVASKLAYTGTQIQNVRGPIGYTSAGSWNLVGNVILIRNANFVEVSFKAAVTSVSGTTSSFNYGISYNMIKSLLGANVYILDGVTSYRVGEITVYQGDTGLRNWTISGYGGYLDCIEYAGDFLWRPGRIYTAAGGAGAWPFNNAGVSGVNVVWEGRFWLFLG